MENASKALIMAGAVLVAIMIISLGVLIFNNFKGSVTNNTNLDKQTIEKFNSEITPYVGESVSGSQVNTLINTVISVNMSAVKNGGPSISITFPAIGRWYKYYICR